MGRICSPVLGVEKGLAHHGDDSHQRAWVGFGTTAAAFPFPFGHLQSDMLKSVRPDDGFIKVAGFQGNKRAGSPDHAPVRHDIGGGESLGPHFLQGFVLRAIFQGHAALRSHHGVCAGSASYR